MQVPAQQPAIRFNEGSPTSSNGVSDASADGGKRSIRRWAVAAAIVAGVGFTGLGLLRAEMAETWHTLSVSQLVTPAQST